MPYDKIKKGKAAGAGSAARPTTKKTATKTTSKNSGVTNLPEVTVSAKRPSKPTQAQINAATDWTKKAKAQNAPAGTSAGKKGSKRYNETLENQKNKPANASSLNRESRATSLALKLEREASAFNNKAHDVIKKKMNK